MIWTLIGCALGGAIIAAVNNAHEKHELEKKLAAEEAKTELLKENAEKENDKEEEKANEPVIPEQYQD